MRKFNEHNGADPVKYKLQKYDSDLQFREIIANCLFSNSLYTDEHQNVKDNNQITRFDYVSTNTLKTYLYVEKLKRHLSIHRTVKIKDTD